MNRSPVHRSTPTLPAEVFAAWNVVAVVNSYQRASWKPLAQVGASAGWLDARMARTEHGLSSLTALVVAGMEEYASVSDRAGSSHGTQDGDP